MRWAGLRSVAILLPQRVCAHGAWARRDLPAIIPHGVIIFTWQAAIAIVAAVVQREALLSLVPLLWPQLESIAATVLQYQIRQPDRGTSE